MIDTRWQKKQVIVIDDDLENRSDYSSFLEQQGFEIAVFSKENEFFTHLKNKSPHISIVHFREDTRRSIRCIAQLHSQDPTISILYVTYYGGISAHRRAIEAGAFKVLEKPANFYSSGFSDVVTVAFQQSINKKRLSPNNRHVFVLMPFAAEFDEFYRDGIKTPLVREGFSCERADEIQFTGGIVEKVYAEIEEARFIVADMTGRNPNVFYEVGYAHALGKVVVLLTQDEQDIPFDLRGQKHIVYEKNKAKLRKELVKTIKSLERS